MELQCKFQNYEWGKLGLASTVANLLSSANPDINIDAEKPYAELWMGTHPNGPSLIIERGILLSEYLKDNHDAIGPDVKRKFGITVPFLLKVLSIRKALSIQAHPTKDHAEQLHKSFPDMYKDPNHKPELAIALTPFEALCGFRPIPQIQEYLKSVMLCPTQQGRQKDPSAKTFHSPFLRRILEVLPVEWQNSMVFASTERKRMELLNIKFPQAGIEPIACQIPEITQVLPQEALNEFLEDGSNLKGLIHSLMTCDKEKIALSLQSFLSRLEKEDVNIQASLLFPLIQRLHSDFIGDVGCWVPFFMNYITLQPGQAIFLKPNLPHAYLSGDCVECMACSDNVVRAGLTPKHIDVPTLIDMLDYASYTKQELLFAPQLEDENSCIWRPPVPDFAVVKIRVESGDSYNTIIRASPSIVLIASGEGAARDTAPVAARRGAALFLKASRQLTLTPAAGSHIEAYQAICNV